MKGRQILLDHMNDRQAAALVEDGKLQDLFLETDLPASAKPLTCTNRV